VKHSRSILAKALTSTGTALAAVAMLAMATVGTASAAPANAAAHAMGTRYNRIHQSSTSNMTYQGGPVETTPVVYIDYWGSQWASGFSTGGYTSSQAQTYINDFFGNVGGSSWDNINSQYCEGVPVGTVNCGSSGTHITNSTGQLKGTWTDATTLPSRITQSAIAAEAVNLMNHFGGYNPNATYFVFTPSGHSMRGFGTQWCAWHSETSSGGNTVAYAYMPYQPDAGTSCGENFVNSTDNSFGNGYFDGFSIVGGHEYAEAMTDPHPASGTYAWIDSSGSEIGDKCAWSSLSGDITLGSNYFAVQPLWSNANSGCVMSY
jgi:hypothetical protein